MTQQNSIAIRTVSQELQPCSNEDIYNLFSDACQKFDHVDVTIEHDDYSNIVDADTYGSLDATGFSLTDDHLLVFWMDGTPCGFDNYYKSWIVRKDSDSYTIIIRDINGRASTYRFYNKQEEITTTTRNFETQRESFKITHTRSMGNKLADLLDSYNTVTITEYQYFYNGQELNEQVKDLKTNQVEVTSTRTSTRIDTVDWYYRGIGNDEWIDLCKYNFYCYTCTVEDDDNVTYCIYKDKWQYDFTFPKH